MYLILNCTRSTTKLSFKKQKHANVSPNIRTSQVVGTETYGFDIM